jgi:hypothetical protein
VAIRIRMTFLVKFTLVNLPHPNVNLPLNVQRRTQAFNLSFQALQPLLDPKLTFPQCLTHHLY